MCGGSGVVYDSPGRRRHRVSLTGIAPLSCDRSLWRSPGCDGGSGLHRTKELQHQKETSLRPQR